MRCVGHQPVKGTYYLTAWGRMKTELLVAQKASLRHAWKKSTEVWGPAAGEWGERPIRQ